jgi:single-strand DNA-binding protein
MIEFSIIGNLGADAVMNTFGEKKIINFAVCHSEVWRSRPENKEQKKYWVDCAFYSDSQELLEMLKKGTQVYAKGTPDVKVHVKKDNDPVATQYLKVSKVEVLSKKRREDSAI